MSSVVNQCDFCNSEEKIEEYTGIESTYYRIVSFRECTNCQSLLSKVPEIQPLFELLVKNYESKIDKLKSRLEKLESKLTPEVSVEHDKE